jgi:hydrogenase maturation protease
VNATVAPTVAVLGLGNVLMSDDGLGPTVIRELEAAWAPHPEVELLDLGTPGLDLLPFVCDRRALVLVDTVRSDGPPGTLRLYRKEAILAHPPRTRLSPHDPGVKEALLLADLEGRGATSVLLVGVVPGCSRQGVTLTRDVAAAVPQALRAVLDELDRLEVPSRPLARPRPVDLWWREPGATR